MSDSNETPQHGVPPLLRTNRGVGVILSAVAGALLLYVIVGTDSFRVLRDGFYLGTFPMIGAGACLVLSLVLLVDRFKNQEVEEMEDLTKSGLLFVVGAVIAGVIFIQLVRFTGFGVAGTVYLGTMLSIAGVRPIRNAILYGFGMTAGVFLLFTIVGINLDLIPEWLADRMLG